MFKLILLSILAYFIGSIPNALWIGKIFKQKDIREYGSGNVGATNAKKSFREKTRVINFSYLTF